MTSTWYLATIPARDISKLSKSWTVLKYHSRYYCQIPLQAMLLPIQILCLLHIYRRITINWSILYQFSFLDNRVRIKETEYESLLECESHASSIAVTTFELGYDKSCSIWWTHQSSLVMTRRARFDGHRHTLFDSYSNGRTLARINIIFGKLVPIVFASILVPDPHVCVQTAATNMGIKPRSSHITRSR